MKNITAVFVYLFIFIPLIFWILPNLAAFLPFSVFVAAYLSALKYTLRILSQEGYGGQLAFIYAFNIVRLSVYLFQKFVDKMHKLPLFLKTACRLFNHITM